MLPQNFYSDLAVAFIRGRARQRKPADLASVILPVQLGPSDPGEGILASSETGQVPDWASVEMTLLDPTQKEFIFQAGQKAGLRLYKFKRTQPLARVTKVIGLLKGIMPENLLDIGSGRGTFLWPLLSEFPFLPVTACDQSQQRFDDLSAVRLGGIENLDARQADARNLPFADNSFDVVTALEVLEHIPDYRLAISEIVRVARRFVLISVPAKEDDNPEHLHLLTRERISQAFQNAGIQKISFQSVLNHLIAVANLQESELDS